jgi:hypothetical protein
MFRDVKGQVRQHEKLGAIGARQSPNLKRIILQDLKDHGMHKKRKKPKFFMFHHFYPLINRFFEDIRPKKIY